MARFRLDLLEERIFQVENEIFEISQQEITIENDPRDIFSEPQGEFWERVKDKDDFQSYTNFIQAELVSLYRQLVPFIHNYKKRGPLPKITYSDSLLILLIFYKTALKINEIAVFLGYK